MAQNNKGAIKLVPCAVEITKPVLCIGVDVAWFGGGAKNKESQKETIAWSHNDGNGWSIPKFQRIDLNDPTTTTATETISDDTTPNADPNGELLVKGIMDEVTDSSQNIVIALDAPLLAKHRELEARGKKPKKGQVERRGCDKAFGTAISSSPKGWREPKVQPGAPLPSRISEIIARLKQNDFSVFHSEKKPTPRLLIECFPNETLWSAGVQGKSPDMDYKTIAACL